MFLVHSNVGALYHQSTQRDNAKVKTNNFIYPLVDNKVYHFKDIIQYKDDNSWRSAFFFLFHLLLARNSKLIVHDLIAQLVEHCIGEAEIKVRIPIGLLPLYK